MYCVCVCVCVYGKNIKISHSKEIVWLLEFDLNVEVQQILPSLVLLRDEAIINDWLKMRKSFISLKPLTQYAILYMRHCCYAWHDCMYTMCECDRFCVHKVMHSATGMSLITKHVLHAHSIFKNAMAALGCAKVRWYMCCTYIWSYGYIFNWL